MSRNRFHTYFDITKIEQTDEGTLLVKGVASSEAKDDDGETILASAVKDAIPDYMKFGAVREMHGDIAAGTAISIEVDDDGVTHLEAEVVEHRGHEEQLGVEPDVMQLSVRRGPQVRPLAVVDQRG